MFPSFEPIRIKKLLLIVLPNITREILLVFLKIRYNINSTKFDGINDGSQKMNIHNNKKYFYYLYRLTCFKIKRIIVGLCKEQKYFLLLHMSYLLIKYVVLPSGKT